MTCRSTANRQGHVREFHIVCGVVTVVIVYYYRWHSVSTVFDLISNH